MWNKVEKGGPLPLVGQTVLLRLGRAKNYDVSVDIDRRDNAVSSAVVLARLVSDLDVWGEVGPAGWEVYALGGESRMLRIRLNEAREWCELP